MDISGGEWPWMGAEYWITTYVAMQLRKMGQAYYVTLERNIEEVMSGSGRTRGRPYNHIRGGKRFDIVLWQGEDPISPIEIKCQQSDIELLKRDLDRVSAAIRQSNMEIGSLGYYFSRTAGSRKDAQQRVKDYICRVEEMALSSFESEFDVRCRHFIDGDTNDAWVGGCLLIEQQ